ncbi:flagellar associated isoform B [Micractinium conductrix]|uniref:glutathione transferase n=1 Tax=Micractinium conductrix TaxID=554055 RepID=A0A2P6VEF4_9CHLO|nr:flagellar associated isoform A [Micractinium conductrix]PSC72459.1 flagellar associated isoform B [Micractinium conductrix]|eukprot:PSC72458.1 flagellar associated isoform A [Micractinium conductrix]
MAKAQVYYFPIRGRAEPVRLALEAAGVEWEEVAVDYAEMKADLGKYPFAQCPRYVDEEGDISQSNTIMRHLGRKHNMFGSGLAEAARIDMLADGVEDIKRNYLGLIYTDQLSDEAKAAYWSTHMDPATAAGARNGGAHFAYLSNLVKHYGGDWAVGSSLSIADILLFDITDVHVRAFGEQFKDAYPELVAHHARVAAQPGIAAYLSSGKQFAKPVGPTAAPPSPAPLPAPAAALPGGVKKLLALELEVVQLQQSLQIVQLEYETRTVQLHSLKQRADDAEQRAQAAEGRAASLAQQAQQLERQAGDLRCQLGEVAARHQQENAQLAARLATAASKQAAAQEEAGRLREALAAARQEGAAEAEAARRAAAQAQAAQRAAAAAQAGSAERVAAARRENQQLRGQVASACGALQALGIPASKVFGPAALAAAGVTGSVKSPPKSPSEAGQAAPAPAGASSQRRSLPPQTPRGQTPRPGSGGGGGLPGSTPGLRGKAGLRPTYGQDQAFLEIRAAYNAVMSSDADRASKWARSVFSSASAVDTDPRRVEPMVQGLLQLLAEHGLHVPLHKCGTCTYKLGAAKLSVRLVSGRLMARAGAGQTLDVLEWLSRQPLPTAR